MQNEITQMGKLLNEIGEIIEPGYARELLLQYNRADIKAKAYRIKEWDYYLITNDQIGVAFTIADNSYMGLISVSFLDFEKPYYKTTSIIKPFTFGKLNLPSSSKVGDVTYKDKRISISFMNDGYHRKIICDMLDFVNGETLQCEILLYDEPKDSMVIATPFVEDKKAFYYNQKINCLKAKGNVSIGDRKYFFEAHDSFGVLDWGRGVWTYKNTWYWGSASGMIDGKSFGFNIGYGFGDTSAASENMLFYDGKAHKLDKVKFNIPKDNEKLDYMKPWTFTSNDNRFIMDFVPIIDRKDKTSIGMIASDQHQVFGRFSGTVSLDDGQILQINNMLGFAERVCNKW